MVEAKRQIVAVLLILALIWAGLIAATFVQVERDRQLVFQQRERLLDTEYRAMLNGYETAIALLLDELSRNEPFLHLLALASDATLTEAELASFRQAMHISLTPFYRNMQRFGFSHLHVYLPDNRSFLRMHQSEHHGDDQTGIRWTVEVANREQRTTSGFEMARIVDGYRTVQPVFHADEHIGAVDIGISVELMLKDLQRLFAEEFQILLRRDILRSSSLNAFAERYIEWPVSPAYALVVAETEAQNVNRGAQMSCLEFWGALSNRFCRSLLAEMEAGNTMVHAITRHDAPYLLALLPLHDPRETLMGYLVSLEPAPVLALIANHQHRQWFWFTLGFAVISALGVVGIQYKQRLQHLAGHDQLTGLYNRRLFLDLLSRARLSQTRTGESLALIMADIDHFKSVNDQWGHQAGDKLLVSFAKALQQNIRRGDIVARWGGEEFVILLHDTRSEAAMQVAEKLRRATLRIARPGGDPLSASFGALTISAHADTVTLEALLAQVDQLLYQAKDEGRNRVIAGAV